MLEEQGLVYWRKAHECFSKNELKHGLDNLKKSIKYYQRSLDINWILAEIILFNFIRDEKVDISDLKKKISKYVPETPFIKYSWEECFYSLVNWMIEAIEQKNIDLGFFAVNMLELSIDALLNEQDSMKKTVLNNLKNAGAKYISKNFDKKVNYSNKRWLTFHAIWYCKTLSDAEKYGSDFLKTLVSYAKTCDWLYWIGIEVFILKFLESNTQEVPSLFEKIYSKCRESENYWESFIISIVDSIKSDDFNEVKESIKSFIEKAALCNMSYFLYLNPVKEIVLYNYSKVLENIDTIGEVKPIDSLEVIPAVESAPKPSEDVFKIHEVQVLRGGDWKIEGNQSVFYFKVKVENNSQFVITNIQILLTSIPRGLDAQSDRYIINSLNPNSYESPTLKLKAQESCVGNIIKGIVLYTTPKGNQQIIDIEPFKIKYVCNLLIPNPISKGEFNEKVEFMEEKKLIIDSDLNISALESKIESIVRNCNFALLEEISDQQREGFRKIEGFARGLFDKQDVALSVAVKEIESGSKLVIKAMSDRAEKVTDLLRDLSGRLDDVKSDTELIKEYSAHIEDLFDKIEDIEEYLKEHLASDFEKIRKKWQDYKTGKIGKKELIKEGLKIIGKKFIKIFIKQV